MKIPITKPYLGEEESAAVRSVLESGWLVQGTKVAEFERMVAQYTSAKFARASSSCTTSLHLALLALSIGPGDEVLVPSFTYIASANSIEYTGARPVFIDIDLNTFNIDVEKIETYLQKAKSKVKAIMPVHLFGLCADMGSIMEIAKKYHLFVIEDAACGMGSLYKGKHSGTFGDAGCLSFHPRKSITTGEGGMVITNSPDIAAKVQVLRDHGATASDMAREGKGGFLLPTFKVLGYNYRMTDIQGAIGIEQIKKFPWIVEKRTNKAKVYDKELKGLDWLKAPYVPDEYKHIFQSYVTLMSDSKMKRLSLEKIDQLNRQRNEIMTELEEKGIITRQGTHAVHTLDYYKNKYGLKDEDYINSLAADRLSMTLPLYPQMTDEEQGYVIENLLKIALNHSL